MPDNDKPQEETKSAEAQATSADLVVRQRGATQVDFQIVQQKDRLSDQEVQTETALSIVLSLDADKSNVLTDLFIRRIKNGVEAGEIENQKQLVEIDVRKTEQTKLAAETEKITLGNKETESHQRTTRFIPFILATFGIVCFIMGVAGVFDIRNTLFVEKTPVAFEVFAFTAFLFGLGIFSIVLCSRFFSSNAEALSKMFSWHGGKGKDK